jgi:hypothetical protein
MGGRSMTWQTVKYSLWHMQSIHFAQFLCNLHTIIMRKEKKKTSNAEKDNAKTTVIQSFQLVIRKTLNICLSGIKWLEIKIEVA